MTNLTYTYYDNGNVRFEEYWLNGKLHREDVPAFISYYENGNVEFEAYYLNDKRHREDGPAIIWYYENGNVREEGYHLNGKKLSYDEWMIATAKTDEEKMMRVLQYAQENI